MLSEAKHLKEIALRCFASLNMTMNSIALMKNNVIRPEFHEGYSVFSCIRAVETAR